MTNESFIKVNNKLVLVNGHPITINGSSSNLQENKAVTITANGTVTVTPDAGYDGLSSVEVTVNVSGGGATEPYIEETYDSNGNLIGAKLHGYTNIRDGMFISQSSLTNIILPTELVSIGYSSFSDCYNLVLTSLPAGLISIEERAFFRCTGLTELTFMGTPTSIASDAFAECNSLTTINVPWAEGAVANAPWGAGKATINYSYTGG